MYGMLGVFVIGLLRDVKEVLKVSVGEINNSKKQAKILTN